MASIGIDANALHHVAQHLVNAAGRRGINHHRLDFWMLAPKVLGDLEILTTQLLQHWSLLVQLALCIATSTQPLDRDLRRQIEQEHHVGQPSAIASPSSNTDAVAPIRSA